LSILILLLNFIIPSANAGIVPCIGGSNNNYGSMICTTPVCDVGSNPSTGCDANLTPPPVLIVGSARRYLLDSEYLDALCNKLSDDSYTCYSIVKEDISAFCDTNPPGYSSPQTGWVDVGSTYRYRQLNSSVLQDFCMTWRQGNG